jgi:hypothetical protein
MLFYDEASFGELNPREINECVDKINNNFDNGTAVGNYLRLP